MSQNDFTIANQGFPAFRSDLNSALQALASLNSGATEPTTTFAYQLWADTTNSLLKIRNSANSGWVTIGDIGTAFLGLVDPATANTFSAAQTFNSGTLKLAGSTSGTATLNPPAAASTYTYTLPAVTGTLASLALAQTFTAAQRGTVSALTDAATITPNFSTANNFSLTIGGNRTLANPTNLTAGQHGSIVITQDATGSRTLAYGAYWKFSTGTAPTLTTTASAVDVLVYYVESSTRITAKLVSDVK